MQSRPQWAAPPQMHAAHMQQHHHDTSLPPPPPYHSNSFQYANGVLQPPPMPSNVSMPGHNGMLRFAIPPQPLGPGVMSSARHKKDIKRRTKTGCLTCRKRRIKCDESHPRCRNCDKSRRECLGYDPIFKPQSGHTLIQPAPALYSRSPTTSSAVSSTPGPYPLSQSYSGVGGASAASTNGPTGGDGAFDYAGVSLDPALSVSGDQTHSMAASSSNLLPTRTVRPIIMDQLFSLSDIPPRWQQREIPPSNATQTQQEISDFYRFHFAPGLDKLFETIWFSTRGFTQLQQDPSLLDFITQCKDRFQIQDPSGTAAAQSLEARLVWQLAILPRSASGHTTGANGAASDQVTLDLLPRIDIVEHLLTGQILPQERIPPPPSPGQSHIKHNEQRFWYELGTFTSLHDDTSDPSVKQSIDDCMNNMRGILGMMENRDVLYSLAVARHIGGRLPEFRAQQQLATSGDPNDEVSKLEIARKFVEMEDQKGTTQVIQRVCGMAMRSWGLGKR